MYIIFKMIHVITVTTNITSLPIVIFVVTIFQ